MFKNFSLSKNVGTTQKLNHILELLESSQIPKCDLICRNYFSLLKIYKELSRKIL
ncbi:hypothetical protein LEP1GSC172_2402 [Leptospira noguchii]|uniref:Uncharacterized protein n=1 Tax=Leptospira noguchii TaxID=28182 RepID=M6VZQ9_9LEPT|nr:hypothetical protein LEP1GSC172_2402 [Leptospira noguchii]